MCGIVGYIGFRHAIPVLLDGLRRLEYRGYDSAGIAWIKDNKLNIIKCSGKLSTLDKKIGKTREILTTIGLGHTRWATHGPPTKDNAHPHFDCKQQLAVVHNGIIENYSELRDILKKEGHIFVSETDTEILAHLIEREIDDSSTLFEAVKKALKYVRGAFALGVIWENEPESIVVARRHSPLVLGIGKEENFLASDIPALLPFTQEVLFLEDDEIAILSKEKVKIFNLLTDNEVTRETKIIDWDASMAEKSGYKHFMLKEIYEQAQGIENTFRGRFSLENGDIILPELGLSDSQLSKLSRIILLACGTSWHAGLVAKYWLEKWAKIPVEVELASEFRYRSLIIDSSILTIPISQSGETADTLAGLRLARQLGSKVISICNVVGSTITRESDGTIYTLAGPEIGVASTKAFTSQLTALYLLALKMGLVKNIIDNAFVKEKLKALIWLPQTIKNNLDYWRDKSKDLAVKFHKKLDFLFLGRNLQFPIALEGALKLKEISYIHAEGYAAGEMKHGPIALIDEDMPVVALAPKDHVYEKLISNIEEVKSRRGIVIAVGEKEDTTLSQLSDELITIPSPPDPDVNPFLYVIPLQLLAYETAVIRGCDVDQPRNLAKSVTVE